MKNRLTHFGKLSLLLLTLCFCCSAQGLLAESCCSATWVTSKENLEKSLDKEVTVVGRYVSETYIPNASTAGVWMPGKEPIPHITAYVVLEDLGEVRLGPPMQKTSLRTPEESKNFNEKQVLVKGKLQRFQDPNSQEVTFWLQPTSIEEQSNTTDL